MHTEILDHGDPALFESVDGLLFVVCGQVVDDDNSVRRQMRDHLLDQVDAEHMAVDGALECAGRHDPPQAKPQDQRDGHSDVGRHLLMGALAGRSARVEPRHAQVKAELVEEEQALGIDLLALLLKDLTVLLNVGSILLACAIGFFFE